MARQASPSASPLRGISERELHELQDEVRDYHEQKILDDRTYHELLAENRDDHSLLEANQAGLKEVGEKYENLMKLLDQVSKDPNATGYNYDFLENQVIDRGKQIAKMKATIAKKDRDVDQLQRDVNEALNVSADRMMRQGKTDRQIKDELSVGQRRVAEHETEAALFKSEYKALLTELSSEKKG
eukprot:s1948_g8.t1